jgi:hypothetical protein
VGDVGGAVSESPASVHIVRTRHVRRLIGGALDLAMAAENADAGTLIGVPIETRTNGEPAASVPVDHALARAANLLRHAAEELEDERLACLGWRQP